jgi:type 1 glutamine amidotransferase
MKKLLLLSALLATTIASFAADKKIVFIAGPPSHGPGQHEHRAGCLLLKSCLDQIKVVSPVYHSPRAAEVFGKWRVQRVTSVVYSNGWPTDASAFDGASAVVIYSDGGPGHPLLKEDRLKTIGALMDKGVGLAAIHYAVEPTKENGQKEFLEWIGGAFEVDWSVNPHWDADFKELPNHPITRGVKPFKINDEWYFNMRFREPSKSVKGITPILTAVPTANTTNRNDGPHEGNPTVRALVAKGEPVHVAWATDRPDGGRGFGFTGAHFHKNWGDDDFRKLVLNAILWVAKADVPKDGVQSTVTEAQLQENLDPKGERKKK